MRDEPLTGPAGIKPRPAISAGRIEKILMLVFNGLVLSADSMRYGAGRNYGRLTGGCQALVDHPYKNKLKASQMNED